MSVLLAFAAACLFALGTHLVLQRRLSRVIVGLGLLTHGANVLLISSGRRGHSPLVGEADPATFADPLPQALALTAIVIGFGVTALLLALAYRSWLLSADDEIPDDVADRAIAHLGAAADTEVDDAATRPGDEDRDDADDPDDPDDRPTDVGPDEGTDR